ncbi:MAG: hypothetical protein AAFN51_10275 [Pseudomonadota bacterium]
MKPSYAIGLIGFILLSLILIAQGTAPLGRVMVQAGLTGAALPLLSNPDDQGVAHFRAGSFEAAADAFAQANDPYNEGLAAAYAKDYARALAAFDRRLLENPKDVQAEANHALIAGLFAGTKFDPVAAPDDRDKSGEAVLAAPGQGKARAAGQGDEANNPKTGFWMPDVMSSGLRRVPKLFDAQFVAADQRWLTTLEDQPGVYLRARLLAEQKARVANGTALPEAGDTE